MDRDQGEPRDERHDAADGAPPRARDSARPRTASRTSTVEMMRREVERRMLRGERFTDVEDAIDAIDLPADEKSALWLLAWSYVHPRAQRRAAYAHLSLLTAATPPPVVARPRRLRVVGAIDAH